MDTFTLAGVAAELRQRLVGAKVQRITQPSPTDIILSFFGHGGPCRLLISTDPQAPRIHVTHQRRDNPAKPPGFCQVARKDLEGARLDAVLLPFRDRIVRLDFTDNDGQPRHLIAELMGRNSNLVLTDPGNSVRGVLRPIRGDSPRPLRPGRPYSHPPGAGTATGSFGRFADAEIAARGEGGLADLLDRVDQEDFDPHAIVDENGIVVGVWAFIPLTIAAERRFPRDSFSDALDAFHRSGARIRLHSQARAEMEKRIEREIGHRERVVDECRRTLQEADGADAHEQNGHLLLAHLGSLTSGLDSAELYDWYTGGTRTIALDPRKSPTENAEAWFDRARRARDAGAVADGRLADAEDEIEQLKALRTELQQTPDETLEDIGTALDVLAPRRTPPQGGPKAPPPFAGHKVRTYDLDGWTLLVGESATANDHLLTRVAAPNDIWLHVRGGTGAHGVLRVPKGARAPDAIVRRAAAAVAAKSGSSKHSSLVAVDYTEKRYVRKPRGAKPGMALYTQAKTVDIEPMLPG